ncbi:hypothetical protein, partial [Brevibacillus borstelensis]|uniref:hypothetical protein n=1 Tax=Brevibacillus borstelensis TaxID=45462 RepID=UPI001C82C99C
MEERRDYSAFRLSRNPTICWSFFFHNNKIEHEVLEVLDSTTPNMPLQGGAVDYLYFVRLLSATLALGQF